MAKPRRSAAGDTPVRLSRDSLTPLHRRVSSKGNAIFQEKIFQEMQVVRIQKTRSNKNATGPCKFNKREVHLLRPPRAPRSIARHLPKECRRHSSPVQIRGVLIPRRYPERSGTSPDQFRESAGSVPAGAHSGKAVKSLVIESDPSARSAGGLPEGPNVPTKTSERLAVQKPDRDVRKTSPELQQTDVFGK